MKINFVSFSEFDSEIEIYNLKKMDLFVYLLVEIIKKGSDKTIKEVLLDLDVTNSLLYLYQNNFYYLLDNKLIVSNSDSEDISEVKVNDVKLSEFGRLCLDKKCVIELEEIRSKNIKYDLLNDKLVSSNNLMSDSNVVVINEDINYLELINKYKKEIFSRYDDNFVLNYRKKECNPYYYSINVNDSDLNKYEKYLSLNGMKLKDNKELNQNNKEFMSSNFKVTLFYGNEDNLVSSEYYLIVDDSKKFTVSGNKIYVANIVDELKEYSFISIDNKVNGYKVGDVKVKDKLYSAFERFVLKDCKGDIKKYLIRNKERFNDLKMVDKVINLL